MNNKYTISGTLYKVGPTQQITERLSKRPFAIRTEGEYPQTIKFNAMNGACDKLDTFTIGDALEFDFQVSGREGKPGSQYAGKIFNDLQVWYLGKDETIQPSEVEPSGDDLPF